MRESAFVVAGREIDMNPVDSVRDEALQEACGQDMVGLALEGYANRIGAVLYGAADADPAVVF